MSLLMKKINYIDYKINKIHAVLYADDECLKFFVDWLYQNGNYTINKSLSEIQQDKNSSFSYFRDLELLTISKHSARKFEPILKKYLHDKQFNDKFKNLLNE